MSRAMHDIKDNLCMMLEEYGRTKQIKAADVEMLHMLTATIKNILKIEILEEAGEYERGGSRRSYDDDYAERRRYSYEGGSSNASHSYNSYDSGSSRDGGRDHLRRQLEEMMKHAENGRQRDAIHECMRKIDNG